MSLTQPNSLLTGGSLLARNGIVNLLGQCIPFLAALVAIPLLIRGLGTDRFGVLTLAWLAIGYFSFFDLGLGRALTHLVAEAGAGRNRAEAPPVVWFAMGLMFGLGVLGTATLSLVSPWLVLSVLKIPAVLQRESLHSFYLLAGAIPIVLVTTALVGILSAYQRFVLINAIRVPLGVFTFLAPVAVLPFTQDLLLVTAVLVAGRAVACGAFFIACRPVMPSLRSGIALHIGELTGLFRLGAWMTVTNVIGPLMVYLDRFVIGAMVSIAAVAYYSTPYEVATKLLIVPGAIVGVLFPAFAASYRQDHDHLVRLFARGTKYIALVLFPMALIITAFAREGLQWWLGGEFAKFSTPVLQCLTIGVFINAFGQIAITFVQGIGRPDVSAKLHLLELPPYMLVLWWAIENHGIVGAATAWTARVALDAVLLLWASRRLIGRNTGLFKRMSAGLISAVALLAMPVLLPDIEVRAVATLVILIAFFLLTWYVVLASDERATIRGQLGWHGSL